MKLFPWFWAMSLAPCSAAVNPHVKKFQASKREYDPFVGMYIQVVDELDHEADE